MSLADVKRRLDKGRNVRTANQNNYGEDRSWSDQYIDEIRKLAGSHLLDVAPLEQDMTEATDLMVFTARHVRIAARVRRPKLTGDLLWQFTMRSKGANGGKTELAKITEGWADLMFYAHASGQTEGEKFSRWFLIDLSAWRAHMIRAAMKAIPAIEQGEINNPDGTAFRWFDLRSFRGQEPRILRASSHDLESAPY